MSNLGPELSRCLLEATIYGSATIIVVILFAPVVRRWLGAQAAHALWFIVLLRLLLPWSPAWEIPRLPIDVPALTAPVGPLADTRVSISVVEASGPYSSPVALMSRPAITLYWPIAVWAMGGVVMLMFLLVRVMRASLLIRRAADMTRHSRIQQVLLDLASPRRLRVCETRELQSPALCGLFHSTILLPTGWSDRMSDAELHHILSHEYGHLRRGDLWWKWAFQIARAVHWFNPLVWLAERISRTDQEMACDEWVLSHHRQTNISQYGKTLLVTSHRLNRSAITSPVHAGMAETKIGLTRRIKQIARFRPHGWKAMLTSFSLAAILWGAFAPSKTNAEPPASSVTQFQTAPEPEPTPPPALHRPKYTQVQIESKILALPTDLAGKLLGPESQSVLSNEEYEKIIRTAAQVKGCDLLSTPTVTSKSGQKVLVKIVKEFAYPTSYLPAGNESGPIVPSEFATRNLGVTIEVAATITSDGEIACVLNPQVVDFLGFLNYGAGYPARADVSEDALSTALRSSGQSAQALNQPIFETRAISTSAVLKSGQTVVLGDMGERNGPIMDSLKSSVEVAFNGANPPNKVASTEGAQGRLALYAFITVRVVDQQGVIQGASSPNAPSVLAPAGPVVSNGTELAYAVAVPGKPGFATSPYAQSAGYVDLRGYPAGAEVRCPYTGRLFLVP